MSAVPSQEMVVGVQLEPAEQSSGVCENKNKRVVELLKRFALEKFKVRFIHYLKSFWNELRKMSNTSKQDIR